MRNKVGNKLPPIKNQQACGSCYAFAATTSLEYSLALSKLSAHQYTGPLSPQEFVDCTGGTNQGCEGGFPSTCFGYAAEYGVMRERDYPYQAVQGSCQAYDYINNSMPSDYAYTIEGDYDSMMHATVNFGAISVGIEASGLQDYSTGIFGKTSASCGFQPNHAVVIVSLIHI